MKKLIPILIMSALLLTGCSDTNSTEPTPETTTSETFPADDVTTAVTAVNETVETTGYQNEAPAIAGRNETSEGPDETAAGSTPTEPSGTSPASPTEALEEKTETLRPPQDDVIELPIIPIG